MAGCGLSLLGHARRVYAAAIARAASLTAAAPRQSFHVRHRLERYGAGRRMEFDHSPPEHIAAAIAEEIGPEVDCRDVEVDGTARAARRLAELL
jgi:hypothetical protein